MKVKPKHNRSAPASDPARSRNRRNKQAIDPAKGMVVSERMAQVLIASGATDNRNKVPSAQHETGQSAMAVASAPTGTPRAESTGAVSHLLPNVSVGKLTLQLERQSVLDKGLHKRA